MIEAPRRVGLFKPWPDTMSFRDVFDAAQTRTKLSGIPTWVHTHREEEPCEETCLPVAVNATGSYDDLVGSPGAFKV